MLLPSLAFLLGAQPLTPRYQVDDSVEFADASPIPERSQLLENVFADPRGFGVAADGNYHYQRPGFTEGTANV